MTSQLVKGADAAYPFDYGILPDDVKVILGYVGGYGCTPHIWSTQEADVARATGRTWCAIWVPPQRGLVAADGTDAARGMLAALPQYGYDRRLPVFLDIEASSYAVDARGAKAAVLEWQRAMTTGGYLTAIAYMPKAANTGWVADWTGSAPEALTLGWRGVQFAGNVAGGKYDLSAFDPALFPTSDEVEQMQDSDFERIRQICADQAQSDRAWMQTEFGGRMNRVIADLGLDQDEVTTLGRIEAKLAGLSGPAPVDPAALASALQLVMHWQALTTITPVLGPVPAAGGSAGTHSAATT